MSPTAVPDVDLLRSSAKLLSAAIAAYPEIEPDDLQEVVRAALGHMGAWFDANEHGDPATPLYEARGVLSLAEYAMSASHDLTDHICDPVLNGLIVAERLVRRGIRGPWDRAPVGAGKPDARRVSIATDDNTREVTP